MFPKQGPLKVASGGFAGAAVVSLFVALAAPCHAQSAEAPSAGPARELWVEGKQLSDAGDFDRAIDRFDRAYEVEHTPSLGLWVARTLARAGRLLEASERYRAIAQQSLPSDASARDWSAKRDAERERQQLLPRIPSVVVVLDGAAREDVSVTVNGQALPANAIGVPRMVNPGIVRVRGARGELQPETSVEVGEGDLKTVRLSFLPPPPPAVAKPKREATPTGAQHAPPGRTRVGAAHVGDGRRLFGYVAMGVGGATLLTGAVFGLLAIDDEARLQNECPDSHCRSSLSSDVDAYESRKTVATVGLLAGAALTTTGLVLHLTAPRDPRAGRLGVYFLGSGAGLRGAF